ncbi:dihydrofolate reductase [Chitinophaga sp. 30R24]|uniref:dihydrofolate reductase n=1 Tax=Chitinophaga sp. 30R24 TaxID=3248838 RepID=UPI003B913400
MRISIIVAASDNNVIGINNMLPWKLPTDLKYFKDMTMGKPIIMGRKTFDSLRKALPGRPNIVITRRKDYHPENVYIVGSLQEALDKARNFGGDELFITGGAQIFDEAWPLIERIYLTRVYAVVHGDAFFPQLDGGEFELISDDRHEADEKNEYAFSFQIWEKVV